MSEVPETSEESSYEKIMKYLKTQEDMEKKRNDVHADENTKKNEEVITSSLGSNFDRTGRKNINPSNTNLNSMNTSDEARNIPILEGKINRRVSGNNFIIDDENVPDKLGYKTVGTQTSNFNICMCCCTCNKSINQ